MFRPENREPNFRNLQLVLEKQVPSRPVLFEFMLNWRLERFLLGENAPLPKTELDYLVARINSFDSAGFDFTTIQIGGAGFTRQENKGRESAVTKSLNEGAIIVDRASFDQYIWPDIDKCDFKMIKRAGEYLPKGMKMIPFSPDGVLENVIGIVGYENLCIMLYEDRELVADIFEQVGSRILQYFEQCLEYHEVGAILQNDDWGFNSQTFLAPKDMREFVFPWHKRIAEAAHKKGKHTILHSCGYYQDVIEDVIEDIKIDGRHSYEDNITPVEQAYEDLQGRIAVLGGMDIDFLTRNSSEAVAERARKMISRTMERGGYALGSGNSVPEYIPDENYLAMIKEAFL